MVQVKQFLSKWGLHCFLLPLFFVLHNYLQYAEMVSVHAATSVGLQLMIFVLVLFLLLRVLIANSSKAACISTVIVADYLFYGNVKQTLAAQKYFDLLARYVVLLPLFFLVTIIVCLFIVRIKNTLKVTFYLNLLVMLSIGGDISRLSLQFLKSKKYQSLFEKPVMLPVNATPVQDLPDVYYLLLDSYPNCSLIKKHESRPSFALDTFLSARNFYVVSHSISNYNNTSFSMNATLNMQYLQKFSNPLQGTFPQQYDLNAIDYSKTLLDIDRSPLIPYLVSYRYTFYNLSIFSINGQTPIFKDFFLTVPQEKIFLYYTLGECIRRDIAWNFSRFTGLPGNAANVEMADEKAVNENKLFFNRRVLDSVAKIPFGVKKGPRFVYVHLYMPHYPYFFNEDGIKYGDSAIYNRNFLFDETKFLKYVVYTNHEISKLTDGLLKATLGKAVIIIQSDHGYPGFAINNFSDYFKNLDAMYFPDKNYQLLYDSLSNVNTFRILLNKYFNAQLPLLKDSSIRLQH